MDRESSESFRLRRPDDDALPNITTLEPERLGRPHAGVMQDRVKVSDMAGHGLQELMNKRWIDGARREHFSRRGLEAGHGVGVEVSLGRSEFIEACHRLTDQPRGIHFIIFLLTDLSNVVGEKLRRVAIKERLQATVQQSRLALVAVGADSKLEGLSEFMNELLNSDAELGGFDIKAQVGFTGHEPRQGNFRFGHRDRAELFAFRSVLAVRCLKPILQVEISSAWVFSDPCHTFTFCLTDAERDFFG